MGFSCVLRYTTAETGTIYGFALQDLYLFHHPTCIRTGILIHLNKPLLSPLRYGLKHATSQPAAVTCQHYKCTDVSTQANADMREMIKPTKIFRVNTTRQKLLRDEFLQ